MLDFPFKIQGGRVSKSEIFTSVTRVSLQSIAMLDLKLYEKSQSSEFPEKTFFAIMEIL